MLNTVFRDVDGSVTGARDAAVVLDTPLFADSDCRREIAWNARVCRASYASVFITSIDAGANRPGPVRVASTVRPAYLTLYRNAEASRDARYQTNVRVGDAYVVRFVACDRRREARRSTRVETQRSLSVRCCVVGGGPAGMMAGFLLARAGVEVIVLEKHADFFRDFRGDTIHPATLRILDQLGLLDAFLEMPHSEAQVIGARFGDTTVPIADFRHVPGRCKFLAFMPQWDFLNFIAGQARMLPTFRLEMEAQVIDFIRSDGCVSGVLARTPSGSLAIDADLVIAADGRHSVLRERAGLTTLDIGAPIDVLWMRLSRRQSDPSQALGSIGPGAVLILIDRGDYFQCGFVVQKGGFEALKARGLPAFRAQVTTLAPFLSDRVPELQDWEQVNLLSVTVDRLETWCLPGLLFIGDAAHAMSPVGGIGINLAIQDAVAAANALAETLVTRAAEVGRLRAVQSRRELPTRLTQLVQVFVQNNVLHSALAARSAVTLPPLVRLLAVVPFLRRIPAYAIGIGFRPERVRTRTVATNR